MEWVRLYLGLYALFGAVVLSFGVDALLPDLDPSAGLFVAGGLGILVASTAGVTRPSDALSEVPPAWAVVSSTLALLSLVAAVALRAA